jgi:acetyltransferase-like isoleucine patch superfamily enzyme
LKGRVLFKLFKYILLGLSVFLKIVPRPLVEWFWLLGDLLPGKIGVAFRYVLAKRLARSLGDNVYFGRCVQIQSWKALDIGDNVSLHKDCYIDAVGGISIGNDVSIAHASSLLSSEHTWSDHCLPIRSNPLTLGKIVIENDVWVGCGVRILAGVKIEGRSILAAGAVVNRSIPPNSLAAGVPAKVVKKL